MLKKLMLYTGALLLAIAAILPIRAATAAPDNLIRNPGAETVTATQPAEWTANAWGTITATHTHTASSHNGASALRTDVTARTSGDAKWMHAHVTVQPSSTYIYSDYYMASVQTEIVAEVRDTSNNLTYYWLGSAAASASTWTPLTYEFTTPSTAKSISVFHLIDQVGWLTIDDVSMTLKSNPPIPQPATIAVSAPAGGSTVSNTVLLSASGSGVSSVQFGLNGTILNAEDSTAPFEYMWDSTTVPNGTYVLTASGRTAAGTIITSAPMQITVTNTIPPQPQPSSLISNSSFETSNGAQPADWHGNGWGTNTRSFSYEASGRSGSRSVKTTVSSISSGDAKWMHTPVAVTPGTVYTYSDWYKASVETQIDAMVQFADGTVSYYYVGYAPAATDWARFTGQFAAPAGAAAITFFHVITKVGSLQIDDVVMQPLTAQTNGFSRPLVSLTFDDAWESIYTYGLPIMQKHGLVSTQYLLSGVTSWDAYMNLQMMLAFRDSGHQIASHTISHPDLTLLPPAMMSLELSKSQVDLRDWTGMPVLDFASPFGAYNTATIAEIKKFYRSHRGVESGYNGRNFDLYNIKVQNVLNDTSADQVADWVAEAQRTNTWLVLVFHQVMPNPERYDTSPAVFDASLARIKASGVAVVTLEQALNEVLPQR